MISLVWLILLQCHRWKLLIGKTPENSFIIWKRIIKLFAILSCFQPAHGEMGGRILLLLEITYPISNSVHWSKSNNCILRFHTNQWNIAQTYYFLRKGHAHDTPAYSLTSLEEQCATDGSTSKLRDHFMTFGLFHFTSVSARWWLYRRSVTD